MHFLVKMTSRRVFSCVLRRPAMRSYAKISSGARVCKCGLRFVSSHHRIEPIPSNHHNDGARPFGSLSIASSSLQLFADDSDKRPVKQGFDDGKPDWIKLQFIVDRLSITLPDFFREMPDLTFYRKDLEFFNNITNARCKGVTQYQLHLAYVKFIAALMWAEPQLKILNINPKIEDGTVRVRWRIVYMNHIEAFIVYKILRTKPDDYYRWIDGYSTFTLDGNGLVYRHSADKVMPDEQKSKRLSPTEVLLSRLSLVPKPS